MGELKKTLPGLYETTDLRIETAGPHKGWMTQVRLRQIGGTGFYEYHPEGLWIDVGTYQKQEHCIRVRDQLKSGDRVFRPGHSTQDGNVPGLTHRWVDVKDEIATLLKFE